MRLIHTLVIHCADTPPNMDIGVDEIRRWHTDPKPKGRCWSDIGYHFVIRRDGTVEKGRGIAIPGAHVFGHNRHSIGICLVGGADGKADYTFAQWSSLQELGNRLVAAHPIEHVLGHRDLDPSKTCPNFDVEWPVAE